MDVTKKETMRRRLQETHLRRAAGEQRGARLQFASSSSSSQKAVRNPAVVSWDAECLRFLHDIDLRLLRDHQVTRGCWYRHVQRMTGQTDPEFARTFWYRHHPIVLVERKDENEFGYRETNKKTIETSDVFDENYMLSHIHECWKSDHVKVFLFKEDTHAHDSDDDIIDYRNYKTHEEEARKDHLLYITKLVEGITKRLLLQYDELIPLQKAVEKKANLRTDWCFDLFVRKLFLKKNK